MTSQPQPIDWVAALDPATAFSLPDEVPARLAAAQAGAAAAGLAALVVTPGPDLRYLTGYDALPLERLTALLIPADGEPQLVAPQLEVAAAQASPLGATGMPIIGWAETQDPFALVAELLGTPTGPIGLDNHMWAEKVLRLRDAMPGVPQVLAGVVLAGLRAVKSTAEIAALMRAGAAIDAVHGQVGRYLQAGRTEAEVGADIAAAILASGHAHVDFVIVAAGPNGASPHHELSDRVIGVGEPVVVDIGGTMPDGYASDCTRMYCVGQPPHAWSQAYEVLQRAQEAGVAAAQVGAACQDVDAAGRDIMTAAGLGEAFMHRTGHGIGMQTHEDPYIVAGNSETLAAGNAFSIEPGFYLPGQYGARIEDIVIATPAGPVRANNATRDLVVL